MNSSVAHITRLSEVLILDLKAQAQKGEPENEYRNLILICEIVVHDAPPHGKNRTPHILKRIAFSPDIT